MSKYGFVILGWMTATTIVRLSVHSTAEDISHLCRHMHVLSQGNMEANERVFGVLQDLRR